jgi:hypothetical protein
VWWHFDVLVVLSCCVDLSDQNHPLNFIVAKTDLLTIMLLFLFEDVVESD